MAWSALPIELTLRILTFFDPTELVDFRSVNSFFKSLIDETTTFQYRIALFASGMINGPPANLTTHERLELLRGYEASWKNIEWNEHSTILSPHGNLWELCGNVWANSRGRDVIDFVQLPSRLRGIPMRQWTLKLDFVPRDFGMDPSQDLLVTIENFRNAPNRCRIQWRTLSTGEKHPLAGSTAVVEYTLTVPAVMLERWTHSIRICGDYIGILFMEHFQGRNELVVWSWRTGVQKLVVLSAAIRSFVFLGDKFLLGSTLDPPAQAALLVYDLEQRTADANTPLLRFLIGTLFHGTSEILLTSDPSPGWSPSAELQVPFHIAGDERIIAMNVQFFLNARVFRCETFLIPTKSLLAQIESLPTKEGNDVVWDLYGLQFVEKVPEHGLWDVWTCFVFGMRYILPRVVDFHGKPMMIIRDLSPRRCQRASEEERKESNALYQMMTRGRHEPRGILKCVPLPESIRDPQHVKLMISEDGIVVREERNTITGDALVHLLTF